mmetsp:Transcript_32164/g.36971  ORF Transcript_32164/g.36971 Transcript_32164/m.36971 type:complete len:81 (-) Transcript_32164:161-403(-)
MYKYRMESLPPNDPNRNHNNNGRSQAGGAAKEQPYDGSNRNSGDNNAPMNIIGDLDEAPAVVMMFLVGVAAWFLREQCVC